MLQILTAQAFSMPFCVVCNSNTPKQSRKGETMRRMFATAIPRPQAGLLSEAFLCQNQSLLIPLLFLFTSVPLAQLHLYCSALPRINKVIYQILSILLIAYSLFTKNEPVDFEVIVKKEEEVALLLQGFYF